MDMKVSRQCLYPYRKRRGVDSLSVQFFFLHFVHQLVDPYPVPLIGLHISRQFCLNILQFLFPCHIYSLASRAARVKIYSQYTIVNDDMTGEDDEHFYPLSIHESKDFLQGKGLDKLKLELMQDKKPDYLAVKLKKNHVSLILFDTDSYTILWSKRP